MTEKAEEQETPLLPTSSPPPPPPPPPPPHPPPPPPPPPYYIIPAFILLPPYPRRRCCSPFFSVNTILALALAAVLLALALYFLWPSDPELQVARLHLDRIRISSRRPGPSIDIFLGVELRVRNPDFFDLDYRSLAVSIGYRGQRLGTVTSDRGQVRARGASYIDADLRLEGIQVVDDASYLLDDVDRGSILLDTVTEMRGKLRVFSFKVPVQGRISCSVNVNPETQKIIHQDCYPE